MLRAAPGRFMVLAVLLCVPSASAAPPNVFTEAECQSIEAFLEEHIAHTNSAMVVGLVDEQGSRVFGAGTLDNGTDHTPDGNSVFFIGSVSKTFTALLLLEMAERGEVALDDAVAKYLPASVELPAHDGRQITLVDLATQSSGLPFNPGNMTGADDREQYETYTVEKMYAFLDDYELGVVPGCQVLVLQRGDRIVGPCAGATRGRAV